MYLNGAYVDGNLACLPPQTDLLVASRHVSKIVELPYRGVPEQQEGAGAAPRATPSSRAHARIQVALTAGVVIVLLGALVIMAWNMVARENDAYARALADTPTQTIRVSSGDSLWSIAEYYQISSLTTSQTIDVIRDWNDLDSSMLRPGMELVVPATVS